jgi:hypothetical protein
VASVTGRGLFDWPARANVPARGPWPKSTSARGPTATICDQRIAPGIGFAPEMIASAIMPHIFIHVGEKISMTAYLISLALAGLIALAVWEEFS